jgi:integrase
MKSSPKRSRAKPDAPAKQGRQGKHGSEYVRTDQEVIDDDWYVKIYKTGTSSNWYVQYNHPSEGQRKRSLRTRNKKEARRKAWDIVSKLRSGDMETTVRRGPRLQEAIDGFLANKRRRGCRESTITEYRRGLAQFCQFASQHGVKRLDQLTPTLLEQYESQLREVGVALKREKRTRGRPAKKNKSTTVHEKVKLVKSLLKWAVAMKLLKDNPVSGYQLPADGDPETYCYTRPEVEAICQNAEPLFSDVFRFLALTGLRQGELMWLTGDDVDLDRRLIQVRAKEFREEGLRWDPKGDDRIVPLSPPALAIVHKMLASSNSRWLFPAPPAPGVVDDRLRASRLWAQLKKAKQAAGVESGTLHSFRHYFVSMMANAGVSAFKLMKIVGHSSLDIILTYYHLDEDDLLAAVDGVDFDVVVDNTDTATDGNIPPANHPLRNQK